ncbi:MazG nucleotide pyrophosphohydrolase domain-containing protein [Klebsiella pneumoniae]|uniref:nucleoside triphosphate pyrophosphohydrolase family protein n=1 Tax=Klebsiella pneumoniae TaxID=573 RepID=UPI001B8C68F4|nr:nucleoside triphosphate pyrophosphohydrolase family protein [Klebsiella pneumoniae]MBQ5002822.1 hypothetical protein [Klebsiella pneumoniae]HBR6430431.1 nucleoside triphosphate pyrophosphohydrolase family protein [Klebsiella pneumoniae]
MITYSDYQESVRKSDKLPTDNPRFIVLGLVGEVGDLVSLVKKEQRDSLKANTIEEHLHEELGDVLWYVTSIINRENFRIDNIVNNAIQKINLKEKNIQPSTLTNLSLIDSFSTNNNLKLNTVEISLQLTISLGSFVSLYSSKNTNNHNEKEITISIFVSNLLLFCFSKKISISRAIDYNLKKINSRWPDKYIYPVPFDINYANYERFPPKMVFVFKEISVSNKKYVIQQCQGVNIGDRLTDNKKDKDDYRFHDVFHICYAVHLGWSPVLRALLHLKRKSISSTDENQDGARAIIIEEGISTFIFSRAIKQSLFENVTRLDYDILKFIQEFVKGYEVDNAYLWQWEKAILDGYNIFRNLKEKRNGKITADFENHIVFFEEI